ncbi:hypothetical protein sos41_27140 [Alphaproteobacteria bacterium SO-S41]|nr:hypothetical protein sos41_27140 [Alphaproteobacteria bacterium SO-S41]
MVFSTAAKRRLLISASMAALIAWPAGAAAPSALPAGYAALFAAAPAKATKNATGAELLKKAQRGLSVALTAAKKLAAPARAKAGPFFKAVSKADKALKDLAAAVGAKDSKALGRALSAASTAVGTLNSTYKRAGIKDKATKEGMRAFNASWTETVKRLKGTKSNPETRQANNRRIGGVKRKVEDLRGQRSGNGAEDAALAYLLGLLDDAMAYNRSDDEAWYANYLFDQAMGWYDGYYDYLGAYDPATAGFYLDGYGYWRSIYDDYLPTYDAYYNGYDYTPYDASVPVSDYVDIGTNFVDPALLAEADTQTDNIGALANEIALTDTDYANMEAADAAAAALPPVDVAAVAATPDPEIDTGTNQPFDEAEAQRIAQEQEMAGEAEADAQTLDSDGDGTPDVADTDDDNDGTPDEADTDHDGDGIVDSEETPDDPVAEDTDGDGQPDAVDNDDDNDGIPDADDPDDNNDGSVDEPDEGSNEVDTDGDGTPDEADADDDNDGQADEVDTDDTNDGEPDGGGDDGGGEE